MRTEEWREKAIKLVTLTYIALLIHRNTCLMRDEKEASKVKQTTKQSNTAHPRKSLFQKKKSCLRWDWNPHHVHYIAGIR